MEDLRLDAVLEAYARTMGQELVRKGGEYHGPCPVENAGEDRFWVHEKGGRVLMGCRGCNDSNSPQWFASVLEALGLKTRGDGLPEEKPKPVEAGCSLAALAARTKIPADALKRLGWSDVRKVFPGLEDGQPVDAVKMPYYGANGEVVGTKYRIRTQGPDHYRWAAGSGARLLGEDWLVEHDGETDLVLVEGETDYATLRQFDLRAAALPGSKNTGCLESLHLDGCERVLVVAENDAAGQKFPKDVEVRVRELGFRMPVLVVRMPPGIKDTNELFQKIPKTFETRFRRACRHARGTKPSKVAANPTEYRPWSVPEILHTKFPPTRWVVPGVLPEGQAWIMGSPKAGKTWFAYEMAVGVAAQRPIFAKWDPVHGQVLYLDLEQKVSEKTRFRWNRVNGTTVPEEGITVYDSWPAIRDGGIDEIALYLEDRPKTSLVVIDVAASIWPSKFDGNVYDAEYGLCREINRLGEIYQCCLLFVHHDRKAEGSSILDAFSGSRARVGAASALMWLMRDVGSSTGKVGVTGRTGVVETVWGAHFDDQRLRWTVGEEIDA